MNNNSDVNFYKTLYFFKLNENLHMVAHGGFNKSGKLLLSWLWNWNEFFKQFFQQWGVRPNLIVSLFPKRQAVTKRKWSNQEVSEKDDQPAEITSPALYIIQYFLLFLYITCRDFVHLEQSVQWRTTSLKIICHHCEPILSVTRYSIT